MIQKKEYVNFSYANLNEQMHAESLIINKKTNDHVAMAITPRTLRSP